MAIPVLSQLSMLVDFIIILYNLNIIHIGWPTLIHISIFFIIYFLMIYKTYFNFHQIGPLGRFGLVVAKSVCLFACLSVCCALPMQFFKVMKSKVFSNNIWLVSDYNKYRGEDVTPLDIIF